MTGSYTLTDDDRATIIGALRDSRDRCVMDEAKALLDSALGALGAISPTDRPTPHPAELLSTDATDQEIRSSVAEHVPADVRARYTEPAVNAGASVIDIDEGRVRAHAFTAWLDEPGRCLRCGRPESAPVHGLDAATGEGRR